MRTLISCLVTLLIAVTTNAALAESDVPDLKGTWVMKMHASLHNKKDTMQPERHLDAKTGFREVDLVLTIDKQEGFRFSGFKTSSKRKEIISGVIGFDNKTVYMAEDEGMAFCRLIGPDKMEQIYMHVTDHRSVAARGILTRKK